MLVKSFNTEHKLLNKADFGHLKEGAQITYTPLLRCYYKNSRTLSNFTRLGLSVSKKVGKATKRNRIKRLLREKFRLSEFRELSKDILIVVSPKYKKQKNISLKETELLKQFQNLLERVFNQK